MKYSIIYFISFFLLTSCNMEREVLAPVDQNLEAVEHLNTSYGSGSRQKYDIYLPKDRSANSTNILVLIHGGGWTSGDKSDLKYLYDYFKENFSDLAIANINYTLATLQKPPIPMQLEDISLFLQHIQDQSRNYNVKPAFIFLGTSAGAHLSMLYSYTYDINQLVKMVCNVVGPTNFLDDSYINSQDQETQKLISDVETLFGKTISENPEFFQSISPLFHVDENSPPTISFYGGNDLLVPEDQGVILTETLSHFKVKNQYTLYPEEGHGWGGDNLLNTIDELRSFIDENL